MSDEYRPMTITVDVDDNVYGRFYVHELDKWNYEDSVPREVRGAEVWVQYRIETCYNLFEGVENPIEEMERLREIERKYHALMEARTSYQNHDAGYNPSDDLPEDETYGNEDPEAYELPHGFDYCERCGKPFLLTEDWVVCEHCRAQNEGYDSLPFWWRMDDYNLKPDDERDE